MSEFTQRLLQEVTHLKQRLDNMVVDGPVNEVKGDKMRVVIGKDKDGKDVLSPWIHTSDHRGGSRERRFYKKGQNVRLFSPSGDIRQAVLIPGSPNKAYPAPTHANETGQDEETYHFDNLRVRKKATGYEVWLDQEADNEGIKDDQQSSGSSGSSGSQSGSSSGQQQKKKEQPRVKLHLDKDGGARMSLYKEQKGGGSSGQQQEQKPEVDLHLHEKNGVTVKVGEKVTLKSNGKSVTGVYDKNRFMVSEKGAKLKAGSDFAVVTSGGLICSKDWVKGQDPMPDSDSDDQK